MSIKLNRGTRDGSSRLQKTWNSLPGLFLLIIRRLLYHKGLSLLSLFGVVLSIGLVTSASFFSEAVDRALLLQEMDAFSSVTKRPPFSTQVYTFPSSRAPVPLDQAELLSQHIMKVFDDQVGLPIRQAGILVSSGGMMLLPPADSELYSGAQMIGNVRAVYIKDVEQHISAVDGQPMDAAGQSVDALDVWVHERTANQMNLNVGETYGVTLALANPPVPVRVAGIWKSTDPQAEFWFNDPDSSLVDALLVRRGDYVRFIQPVIPSGSREASWYLILDENAVIPKNGPQYIEGFAAALNQIQQFLPNARLNSPPLDPLKNFVTRSTTYTVILLAYNMPAFGILLYFLVITATIIGQWQRRENTILVGRGANTSGLFAITFLEQMTLFAIGFPVGVGFGMLLARWMSYADGFISLAARDPLAVSLYGLNPILILLTLGFTLVSRLLPALQAARSTLVAEEREWSRPMRAPFWYRYFLDFLLFIPAWYAYDQMNKRGSLAGLIETQAEDLFSDPLLILVPALLVIAGALVTMRLFAVVMRLIDLAATRTPWVTLHLALRQLGRQSQDYIRPLLLVIVSLAIGVYTIAMAASLDRWLEDRMTYRSGAQISFEPYPPAGGELPMDGSWIPPIGDMEAVPGVGHATRVGEFRGRLSLGSGAGINARLLAVDRASFAQTAWWRGDFAYESLGAMMNRLALTPEAAIISRAYFEKQNLNVGDRFTMLVSTTNRVSFQAEFTIVGTYDYFPTAYEEESGVTVIGNFDYIGMNLGFDPNYNVWVRLDPGMDGETVVENLESSLGFDALDVQDAGSLVAVEKGKLERVGIFGTLTVGFLATAVMAVMGLLVYSYASLRQRLYRFAILNAIGLERRQIIQQVITEYAFLTLFGTAAGSLIGIGVARLVVPFFRYTGEANVPLPPIVPVVQTNQMILLAAVFTLVILAAEVGTIMTIFYQQLARLIKSIQL